MAEDGVVVDRGELRSKRALMAVMRPTAFDTAMRARLFGNYSSTFKFSF